MNINEHVKAFSHKPQLIKHSKTQTEEKHYNFSDFRQVFPQKSDHIKHQRAHKGETLWMQQMSESLQPEGPSRFTPESPCRREAL